MVANSGSLITAEHIRRIFDRFYQSDLHHAGSGIGLALVKSFVELHGGAIEVTSDEKQGTLFIVTLPATACGAAAVLPVDVAPAPDASDISSAPDEPDISPAPSDPSAAPSPLSGEAPVDSSPLESDKPIILLIDDNADIRSYIRSLLCDDYSVVEAADGNEGIRRAMTYTPDVIISDIMMPGIDGIECCRRLKNELQTSHIPVILLTACSLDEQRAEGYECGADSYIAKPFDSRVLRSRVRNLLAATQRIRQSAKSATLVTREGARDIDKEFVEKFRCLIEERLGDSTLNVEDIGSEMGLSRVQLYRKIKLLTNYSPNELLRMARLRRAASLLASSGMSVSEVCYEVGFTAPSYFAKCYRAEYGENPSDIVKRKGGE
jgi:CheY-like chemotaxis protein/methylphosphotriester-DNA--protein-cysteine methyltransferase